MTDDEIQAYADEMWPVIKDHDQDCPCRDCWEYVAITQK